MNIDALEKAFNTMIDRNLKEREVKIVVKEI